MNEKIELNVIMANEYNDYKYLNKWENKTRSCYCASDKNQTTRSIKNHLYESCCAERI
jgi:hypothetical protein